MKYKRMFVGNRFLYMEERLISKEDKFQRFYKLLPYADANGWLRRSDGEPMCMADIFQVWGCERAQGLRWLKQVMQIQVDDQHLMCTGGQTLNRNKWAFSVNPYLVWRDRPQKRMVFQVMR